MIWIKARVTSSILMIHLIEYLQQHPDNHVVLIKPAFVPSSPFTYRSAEEPYSILLKKTQDPQISCLERVHIKYGTIRSKRVVETYVYLDILIMPTNYTNFFLQRPLDIPFPSLQLTSGICTTSISNSCLAVIL